MASSLCCFNPQTPRLVLGSGGGVSPSPERNACWCHASCKPSNPWIMNSGLQTLSAILVHCVFLPWDANRACHRGSPYITQHVVHCTPHNTSNWFTNGSLHLLKAPLLQPMVRKIMKKNYNFLCKIERFKCNEIMRTLRSREYVAKRLRSLKLPFRKLLLLNTAMFDMCLNCHSWSAALRCATRAGYAPIAIWFSSFILVCCQIITTKIPLFPLQIDRWIDK